MSDADRDVTQLLVAANGGDGEALNALLPIVYEELRRIAARSFGRERPNHTLQPTALVHEAYLRLINQHSVEWQNRAQFYGLAAQLMRRILLKHAERRRMQKRGGGEEHLPLDQVTVFCAEQDLDMLALNQALNQLAEIDEAKASLVELKFFGGLTTEEISAVTGKSIRTVEREWKVARGFLFQALAGNEDGKIELEKT